MSVLTLLSTIGIAAGGIGRLGIPIINTFTNYLSTKQQIKLKELDLKELELKKDSPVPYEDCKHVDSEIKQDNIVRIKGGHRSYNLEKKEPKKFLFATCSFVVFLGILCFSVYYQTLFYKEVWYDVVKGAEALIRLEIFACNMIGFIVSWTLTGQVLKINVK